MIRFALYIIFFFYSALISAQVKDAVKIEGHGENSYHCSSCDHYLFSEKEVIKEEGEKHYHVLPNDSIDKTAIYCQGCNSHIGFFNKEKSEYQIITKHLEESKQDSEHNCSFCDAPIFKEENLLRKDSQYSYYSESIKKHKVTTRFYKKKGSEVLCAKCGAYLGEANKNKVNNGVNNYDVEGFGLRIKLGSISKK